MADSRRLAAILFTDIVGSTTMMQHDELLAVSVAKRYAAVLKQSVASHAGEVLNDYGDGSLCVFSSAIEAVQCSIEIQQQLQVHPAIPLRIGLHIGEIFFEDGKVFGDGVNIASRIQSLGHANTVLLSKEVVDNIKNRPEFKTLSLGHFEFKNVDNPVEVFALATEGLAIPQRNQLDGKLKERKKKKLNRAIFYTLSLIIVVSAILSYFIFFKHPPQTPGKKISIAIIPFRNQTMKSTMDGYCYGIASEIRTQLSLNNQFEFISSDQATYSYKESKLSPAEIGKQLGVDYLLLGSMYQVNDRLKIMVELADGKSSKSLWSLPPYLSTIVSMEDLFSVQSNIAQKVLEKFSMEKKYSPTMPTTSLAAYNFYLKARESKARLDMKFAAELFEKAIQLDSNFLSAYQGLVFARANILWNYATDTIKRVKELKPYIDQMDQKFPDAWETFLAKGSYYYHGLKDFQLGLEYCQKAFSINPNSDDACHLMGGITRRRINSKEALYYNQRASESNPSNPTVWHELNLILSDNGNLPDALKAEIISKNLGMSESFVNEMILGIAKENGTLDKLPGIIKKYFGIRYQAYSAKAERNWKELLRIANSPEQNPAYSGLERAMDKAYAFYFLGKTDSAKRYASLALRIHNAENLFYDFLLEDMEVIKGNNEKALIFFNTVAGTRFTEHNGQNVIEICNKTKALIRLLAFIGDYKQAVDLLVEMNRNYPGYGNYAYFYSEFHFDRIRKEYPPFNEAIRNLKLPAKIDVSEIIKNRPTEL